MNRIRNLTGLSAIGPRVVLIADGPSKEDIVEDQERLVEFDCVAVVNMACHHCVVKPDLWFSLHPDIQFVHYPQDYVTKGIGFKYPSGTGIAFPYQSINERLFHCGTSSLFALENLLGMGYEEIHMYGVDLSGRYEEYRKLWKPIREYFKSGQVVNHTKEKWF